MAIDDTTLRGDVISVLMKRPKTTTEMLDAIKEGKIAVADLSLDQRQSLRSHPNREVRNAAEKLLAASGGLVSADRQKVLDTYMPTTHATGDAKIGKACSPRTALIAISIQVKATKLAQT